MGRISYGVEYMGAPSKLEKRTRSAQEIQPLLVTEIGGLRSAGKLEHQGL